MNEMIVSVEQTNGILNISNYDEIKANVQASMELYETMVFTEDTLIEAKSTVATLRKLSKCLDDKRKDVKRRYMQPYEEFEDKIKELQQIIAEPIELISQQTKEYEDKRIEQKKEEIQKVYDNCIEGMQEYLPLSRIYSKTWENKGTSIKKIKEAIETLVDNAKMSVESSEVVYELIALFIILSLCSFVKFIILLITIFKVNMNEMAKSIDDKEKYENDLIAELKKISMYCKKNNENK